MKKSSKIWYSFKGGQSLEDHISFYNPADFDWIANIENSYSIIAEEIALYLKENEEKIKPYFNTSLVTKNSKWRTSSFFFWLWPIKKNMKQCPRTMAILKKVPGILSASISILEKNTTIKPHRGDTDAIVRAHFPLIIPEGLPHCGFKVNKKERSWEEGKILLFNDAAEHTAWNNTNHRRYVLIFDIIRPQFSKIKYRISSMVLAGLLMQAILQKLSFLNYLPRFVLGILLYTIAFLLNPVLRIQSYRVQY
jgi:aspartyl/asparaginyl beta-hydroxylase (cupin superfamily)